MTYEDAVGIRGTIGLILFMSMFAVVLAYALWPRNKDKFDKASRAPLDEE